MNKKYDPDNYKNEPVQYTDLKDQLKEVEFGVKLDPEAVICKFKWDYPIVNLVTGHARTCCRVPKQVITKEDLDKYGKDVFQNHPYEQDRRREKLLGLTHKDCESCIRLEWDGAVPPKGGMNSFVNEWMIEKNNYYPHKVIDTSSFYRDSIPKTAEELPYNHPYLRADKPQMLEIILGNSCDLKCTYCSMHYSSQWVAELVKFGEVREEDVVKHNPVAPEGLDKAFWEWFYDVGRHHSETINILGGEPTYIPKFYDVLGKLCEAYEDLGKKDRHVELGILTNMNTNKIHMEKFLTYFPKLTKHLFLRLQPSIESMGSRAEYIRYGLSWNRLEDNLVRILSSRDELGINEDNFGIGFQMALNTFSISSLPGFVKWTDKMIDKYGFEIGLMKNVVSFPRHHNPHILTPDFHVYLQEAYDFIETKYEKNDRAINKLVATKNCSRHGSWQSYNEHLLGGLIKSIKDDYRSDYDLESRVHFFNFVNEMKRRRGVNFFDTFPEMNEFYITCFSASLDAHKGTSK